MVFEKIHIDSIGKSFIEKGKKTGFYADTFENRKAGRVGQQFGGKSEKKGSGEKGTPSDEMDKAIEKKLSQYPDNATSWGDADDGIRDLAREVRETYNELTINVLEGDKGYVESLDFKSFKTPSEWNTKAKKQIRTLWSKMTDWSKENVIENIITD